MGIQSEILLLNDVKLVYCRKQNLNRARNECKVFSYTKIFLRF